MRPRLRVAIRLCRYWCRFFMWPRDRTLGCLCRDRRAACLFELLNCVVRFAPCFRRCLNIVRSLYRHMPTIRVGRTRSVRPRLELTRHKHSEMTAPWAVTETTLVYIYIYIYIKATAPAADPDLVLLMLQSGHRRLHVDSCPCKPWK